MLYSLVMLRNIFWKPYSHVLIVSDSAGWALDEEARGLLKILSGLGIPTHIVKRLLWNKSQIIHYTSQFTLYQDIYKNKNRISVDYFHGAPELGESYKKCFEALKEHHRAIERIRVSTSVMETLIKSSGIDPQKVFRIPIGIDTNIFKPQTKESKSLARKKMNIPENAVVIGSFQKDGVGWGEGNEPKLIKGPDIFLKVIEKLKQDVPNLWVLLSGPSRGYVKTGLEALGVPYRHDYLFKYSDVSGLYDALDLYLITSREEGGPKACLESMAKGVPLVTTAVGQCKDLVVNGKNAMMAPIEDVGELCNLSLKVLRDTDLRKTLIEEGFITAKDNSYESQLPLWREYFKKLITF